MRCSRLGTTEPDTHRPRPRKPDKDVGGSTTERKRPGPPAGRGHVAGRRPRRPPPLSGLRSRNGQIYDRRRAVFAETKAVTITWGLRPDSTFLGRGPGTGGSSEVGPDAPDGPGARAGSTDPRPSPNSMTVGGVSPILLYCAVPAGLAASGVGGLRGRRMWSALITGAPANGRWPRDCAQADAGSALAKCRKSDGRCTGLTPWAGLG